MACADLVPIVGVDFDLPAEDPFVAGSGDAEHAYVDASTAAWDEHAEWMDFLEEDSPAHGLKKAERDLCMHHWAPWLDAERVLDVGCGVGRFAVPLLDRGAEVIGVDPDLTSLRHCAWHAAGRAGRLDLHWSSAHALPAGPVDLAIAAEVLCYVPDAGGALAAMCAQVRPGGAVLITVEARWGWAATQDTPEGTLDEALDGTGVLDVPGDRWVRTYEAADVEALLRGAGLEPAHLVPTHWITDGPLEAAAGSMDLRELLQAEERCRAHPVWGPLHRLWLAVGIKPG